MIPLTSLWLPVLLGGLAAFLASFLMRMVLKHHWSDFKQLPGEEAAMTALRAAGVDEGQYSFPFCSSPAELKSEEWNKAWATGPAGHMYIWPKGPYRMGSSLIQSLAFNFAVTAAAAWVASLTIPAGGDWKLVAKVTGTVAFLAYGGAELWTPIWKGGSWFVCLKELLDCAVYGFCTAAVFIYFWPAG